MLRWGAAAGRQGPSLNRKGCACLPGWLAGWHFQQSFPHRRATCHMSDMTPPAPNGALPLLPAADTLTFGLVVMAVAGTYQLFSRGLLASITASCGSVGAALEGRRWGLWAAYRAGEAVACHALSIGDALLGLGMLLAAPWLAFRSGLLRCVLPSVCSPLAAAAAAWAALHSAGPLQTSAHTGWTWKERML